MTVMLFRVLPILFVAVVVWGSADWRSVAFAQDARPAAAASRPSRPQPAIDPLTAVIQGRVTTADSGAPIRRAEVRAIANGGISRLATTDVDGRFQLRDMPAGQYRLTVSKSGFVPLTYGQRRPLEAPRVIDLKQGQQVSANIALPRGGAIAGRVYDAAGEALVNVRVQALRSRTSEGRRRLEPIGPVDRTDDTGSYRLYGLPPGDYYVTASPALGQDPAQMGGAARLNAPPNQLHRMTTFYPGTATLADALRVTIAAGSEVRADMQIGELRAATVSGVVLTSSGVPASGATVTLRSEAIAMGVSAIVAGPPPLMVSGHSNPDGTFALTGVPPGPYTLVAMVHPAFPDAFAVVRTTDGSAGVLNPDTGQVRAMTMPPVPETAAIPIVVTEADVTGLTMTTGSGGSIEGTFVADRGVTQRLPERLEATARSGTSGDSVMRLSGDGTFRLMGLNGPTSITVDGLPEGWALKSIVVDGTDVTDQPVDLRDGRQVSARIVLTDRVTVVTGSVTDERARVGDEPANYNVVVFPDDANKWTYPSRYVKSVRADEQGAFRISGLPVDERYLAVAVDFLEDGEWTDPEFLDRIRAGAASFSLSEGERRAVDLRLVRR
jgi:hypothetical protein